MDKQRLLSLLMSLGIMLLFGTGCGSPAPAASQEVEISPTIAPTNTVVPPTFTLLPPTSTYTPLPPTLTFTPLPPSAPPVKIVAHPPFDSNQIELWLEFTYQKGTLLSGDTLSQYLANGALIVTLPDGTQQTIAGIPPVPMDAATAQDAVWLPEGIGISNLSGSAGSYFLSEYTLENYSDTPQGPQIRIPLGEALRGCAAGEYQLSWRSIDSFSSSITFEWDGQAIISVLDH